MTDLISAYQELFDWSRKRNFEGYDPFDALNSKLLKATPFNHSRIARLALTQLLKRSPINLRPLFLVPPGKNPKAIALLALAALATFRRVRTQPAEHEARNLLEELLSLKLEGWSGAAWGYNFDWQSRIFFAPRGTPTIVPTAFAARALIEAAQTLSDHNYLTIARTTCDFIQRDLPRSYETASEVCFSYSPAANTTVFNASLLSAEVLAAIGAMTEEKELCDLALKATRYVVNRQHHDGSWFYGAAESQRWIDNFHTAFLLSSLIRIDKTCGAAEDRWISEALRRGYNYWRTTFFLADGRPKYYHDELYPADTHAAATAIAALCDLRELDSAALNLAEKIASWSIANLRDPNGFFYYQRRRLYTVRTPFMRWSQSWMLYGLARLLEETHADRS